MPEIPKDIPSVSDYSHWNEDAQMMWFQENKYDMENPMEEVDWDDPRWIAYEQKQWERTREKAAERLGMDPKEVPDMETIEEWQQVDGGCESTDGCWVEVDGTCPHGKKSWLLVLGLA